MRRAHTAPDDVRLIEDSVNLHLSHPSVAYLSLKQLNSLYRVSSSTNSPVAHDLPTPTCVVNENDRNETQLLLQYTKAAETVLQSFTEATTLASNEAEQRQQVDALAQRIHQWLDSVKFRESMIPPSASIPAIVEVDYVLDASASDIADICRCAISHTTHRTTNTALPAVTITSQTLVSRPKHAASPSNTNTDAVRLVSTEELDGEFEWPVYPSHIATNIGIHGDIAAPDHMTVAGEEEEQEEEETDLPMLASRPADGISRAIAGGYPAVSRNQTPAPTPGFAAAAAPSPAHGPTPVMAPIAAQTAASSAVTNNAKVAVHATTLGSASGWTLGSAAGTLPSARAVGILPAASSVAGTGVATAGMTALPGATISGTTAHNIALPGIALTSAAVAGAAWDEDWDDDWGDLATVAADAGAAATGTGGVTAAGAGGVTAVASHASEAGSDVAAASAANAASGAAVRAVDAAAVAAPRAVREEAKDEWDAMWGDWGGGAGDGQDDRQIDSQGGGKGGVLVAETAASAGTVNVPGQPVLGQPVAPIPAAGAPPSISIHAHPPSSTLAPASTHVPLADTYASVPVRTTAPITLASHQQLAVQKQLPAPRLPSLPSMPAAAPLAMPLAAPVVAPKQLITPSVPSLPSAQTPVQTRAVLSPAPVGVGHVGTAAVGNCATGGTLGKQIPNVVGKIPVGTAPSFLVAGKQPLPGLPSLPPMPGMPLVKKMT